MERRFQFLDNSIDSLEERNVLWNVSWVKGIGLPSSFSLTTAIGSPLWRRTTSSEMMDEYSAARDLRGIPGGVSIALINLRPLS